MIKKSASEQITEQLRKDIITKKYKLNEHLVEAKVSSDMGASTTPIRQAFLQLAKEGLLIVYPYRGVCVMNIDEDVIDNIKVARCMIEFEAAKAAYDNMVEKNPQCLMDVIKRAESLDVSDSYALLSNDILFHECIIRYAENAILMELWKTISSRVMLLQSYAKPKGDFPIERFKNRHMSMAEAVAFKKGRDIFLEAHRNNLMEAYSESEIKMIYNNRM